MFLQTVGAIGDLGCHSISISAEICIEERRKGPSVGLLMRVLEEISHGVLVLTETAQVYFANAAARKLIMSSPLGPGDRACLQLANPADQTTLLKAVRACRSGRRSVISIGVQGGTSVSLGVSPMGLTGPATREPTFALVTVGKSNLVDALGLQFFSQTHSLTSAEIRVVEFLCEGMKAMEIARQCGVACSTVRSQVRSILQKTQATGIRDVVSKVVRLPPMVSAIH